MTADRSFRTAARLGLATTLLMYALIVIGSVVRATGSGLSCPDWPLCEGRLIPPLEPHVLIEWFHRLVALLLGTLLAITVIWALAHRAVARRLGGVAALAVLLYFVQALLGAFTVWKGLSPPIVSAHLAVGLLLFGTLLAFTMVARRETRLAADRVGPATGPAASPGLQPLLAVGAALAYGQILLGGLVSSHHAGLACPDWPTCYGRWFPPLVGLVGLQMLHRFGAYALTAWMFLLALVGRRSPDPALRALTATTLALTFVQVALGVGNVLFGTPVWLSALHLGMAAALLGLLVLGTFQAALPAPRGARLAEAFAP
jgi:cytochrome c oxidase assembly protein subunit 15